MTDIDGREFLRRFIHDEGDDGAQVALQILDDADAGDVEIEFNVWILTTSRASGVLSFVHDFDPYEGTMALDDFVAGVKAHMS